MGKAREDPCDYGSSYSNDNLSDFDDNCSHVGDEIFDFDDDLYDTDDEVEENNQNGDIIRTIEGDWNSGPISVRMPNGLAKLTEISNQGE